MTAPIPPLFGGPLRSTGTPAIPSGPLHLVEFRAGRMTLRDRMVTPDRRKGLIYVFQSDDGLAHFCWKDRTSGTVEEDLIIFPEDVSFDKLSAEKMGGRGGRVFILRFKSNPARKFFFWSQEPRTEVDDTICERILEAINNPAHVLATMMASRGGSADASGRGGDHLLPPGAVSPLGAGGTFTEADLQALLGAYSPQQLLSWMNSGANSRPTSAATPFGVGAAPAATSTTTSAPAPASQAEPSAPPAPTATTTSASQAQPPSTPATTTAPSAAANGAAAPRRPGAADLAAALRAIGATMAQGKSARDQEPAVPLSDILAPDAVISSATAPGTATDRLIAHLPPGTGLPEDEELIASLRSPQFQQAANMLSSALETGQLGPLLMEMGVAREAVTGVHDVETFLRALQQQAAPATPASTNGNSTNGASKAVPNAPKKPPTEPAADANGTEKKEGNGDDTGASPMEH